MNQPINNLYFLVVSLILVLSLGCTKTTDFKPMDDNLITPENATNTTYSLPVVVDDSLKVNSNFTNVFFFKSEDDCAFIVTPTNITYLIDCGSRNYLETIGKIKKLGYEKIDYFVVSNNLKENEENIDKLALKFKPKEIYNNGLPTDYDKYKEFNFSKTISTALKTDLGVVSLNPTYIEGFLPDQKFNTIIPIIENKVVVMGSCSGDCQKRFTQADIPIMSLANNGNCDTNPTLFLIQINPSTIITNTDTLCESMLIEGQNVSLKADIEAMDLKVYNRKQYDIQIILGESNEIKTK